MSKTLQGAHRVLIMLGAHLLWMVQSGSGAPLRQGFLLSRVFGRTFGFSMWCTNAKRLS